MKKLNLVVASMSILGLIATPSGVAFAKKKHHKKHHRHMHAAAHHDYKDMGSLPVQPAPMEPACTVSSTVGTWNEMTQNVGRALPNNCNPGWWNRIALSGGMNFDLFKFGNREANFVGQNYKRFSINDAYLNVSATANDWARGFVSLSYANPTAMGDTAQVVNGGTLRYATGGYGANYNGGNNNTVSLEQAYIVLGNVDMSPMFVQIGKGFVDFNRYEIHPITRSMTQVLSEVLATQAKVGFITPNGFHGSLYGFEASNNKVVTGVANGRSDTVWGLALGYDMNNEQMGWDVGFGYLSNFLAVSDVARVTTTNNQFNSAKGAYSLYGDVNSGPFSLGARYVTSTRLNVSDIPRVDNGVISTTEGAKPWAFDIKAGYTFEGAGKNQNVYLGYQVSRQAASIGLPKNRWLLGYNIDAWKYTNVGLEFTRDKDYSNLNGIPNGGAAGSASTDASYNLLSVRAAIKFS